MSEGEAVSVLRSPERVRAVVRALCERASDVLVVALPGTALPEFRAELRAAVERDVLVVLLCYRWSTSTAADAGLDDVATVARATPRSVPTYCLADDVHGLVGASWMVDPVDSAPSDAPVHNSATVVHDNAVAFSLFGEFVGNYWQSAEEVTRPAPAPLPVRVEGFRRFVLQAFAHLQAGTPVRARARLAEFEDGDQVSGQVINVRQSLVYPITSVIPVQHALVLDVDGDRTTVGGPGAYLEDHAAIDGRLEAL